MKNITVNIYEKEGIQNTEATLQAVKKRAGELGISQIVTATTTGQTALKFAEELGETDIIAVTMHAVDRDVYVKRHGEKVLAKDPEIMEKARKKGVKFYTGVHPLRGALSSTLKDSFGGYSANEVISETLMKLFSTGTKVAVECALMAADAGYLNMQKDIIVAGGYKGGVDTALVIKPAYSYSMFDMKIREFISFPENRA
jgi:hypothetical protein